MEERIEKAMIWFLIGSLAYILLVLLVRHIDRREHRGRAVGTIIEITEITSRKAKTLYRAELEYTDSNGVSHRVAQHETISKSLYYVGQECPVLYNLKNPDDAYADVGEKAGLIYVSFMLVVALFDIIYYIYLGGLR